MPRNNILAEVLEVFVGTLGVGLAVYGVYCGIRSREKLLFVPIGLALMAFIFWRQRKRRLRSK
jgi:hypothetical protein